MPEQLGQNIDSQPKCPQGDGVEYKCIDLGNNPEYRTEPKLEVGNGGEITLNGNLIKLYTGLVGGEILTDSDNHLNEIIINEDGSLTLQIINLDSINNEPTTYILNGPLNGEYKAQETMGGSMLK